MMPIPLESSPDFGYPGLRENDRDGPMDSFLDRLRWADLTFIGVMAVVVVLTFRLAARAWKKEKEKTGK